jgi:hypothetical protein
VLIYFGSTSGVARLIFAENVPCILPQPLAADTILAVIQLTHTHTHTHTLSVSPMNKSKLTGNGKSVAVWA